MSERNRISWLINKKFHESTAFARTVPNFLITGSSYCGKTLLYNYLTQHPHVSKNLREETGYFISNSEKGINWYRSNFPLKLSLRKRKNEPLVGETINLAGTLVPERISKIIKEPKIIAILRNPVDRTYARYLALVREGFEKLSFEDAIENERNFFVKNEKQMIDDKIWPPLNTKLPLYRLSGIYIDYILRWNQFFPMTKILVISSESLFENPIDVVNKSLEFLEKKPLLKIKNISINYEKKSEPMKEKTRESLIEYFRPHNIRLFEFIGEKFDWNK